MLEYTNILNWYGSLLQQIFKINHMISFNIVEISQFALMLSLPPGIAVESDISYKTM